MSSGLEQLLFDMFPGKIICCICFNPFDPKDAYTEPDGTKVDMHQECGLMDCHAAAIVRNYRPVFDA